MEPKKSLCERCITNDGTTQTQIDRVPIDRRFSSNIIDVRSYRETMLESDHTLVKILMRSKWPRRSEGNINVRPKFNIDKLKSDETKTQYQSKINQLMSEHGTVSADVNVWLVKKRKSPIKLQRRSSE